MPFEDRLREAREALASPPAVTTGSAVDLRGEGEAADGRVRAVAVTGGRLDTLELDPRVLRMAPEELAAHIVTALNGALDSVREQASAEQVDAVPDPAVLLQRLREVQNQGLRQLGIMTRGINDALAGIQDRAYVNGEAGFPGLENLLDRVQEVVRPAASDDEPEPGTAEGTAADERVRVRASISGRIEDVRLEPGVTRRASHELASHVVDAANGALDEARALASERLKDTVDADLRERVQAIQDESIEQLSSITRSLTALMNSIRKR